MSFDRSHFLRRRSTVAGSLVVLSTMSLALHLYLVTGWPVSAGAMWYGVRAFLRFFTIHANILALLVAWGSLTGWPRVFVSPRFATAVVMYMVVVGVVYLVIISSVWQPAGLPWVVDVLLHYVLPPAYVAFWAVFIPKGTLRWGDVFWWLMYPLAYVFYDRWCAAMTGLSPYPFLDTAKLGVPRVILFVGVLMVVFILLGLGFVVVDRLLGRSRQVAIAT